MSWNSDLAVDNVSFFRMLQVFFDKTVTSLKPDEMLFYPMYVARLNVRATFRHFIIAQGCTIAGFLPGDTQSRKDTAGESLS